MEYGSKSGEIVSAYIRRADEGTLSSLLVEGSILLAASRGNLTAVLRDAASTHKVDTDAIALKVKQEFAAKAAKKRRSCPSFEGRQMPPLFSSPPKITQGETLLVSTCDPHPAWLPAPARRLRVLNRPP